MRDDDQWFEPGDKVMLVEEPQTIDFKHGVPCPTGAPEMGKVYCVERCWQGSTLNLVHLVGFERVYMGLFQRGWRAARFRKVEEIQICVRAAQKALTPVEANTQGQPRVNEPNKK